jgi:hypothetical protein
MEENSVAPLKANSFGAFVLVEFIAFPNHLLSSFTAL